MMYVLSSTVTLMVILSSTVTMPLGPDQVLITGLRSNPEDALNKHITSWGLPTVLLTDGTADVLEIRPGQLKN